jgi:oligoribonuclease (3'-5' exoribonuclease)
MVSNNFVKLPHREFKQKYASIDLETLGIDEETSDVIEVGIVLDDFETPLDELPFLHFYVTYAEDIYKGSAAAMAMNHSILQKIASRFDQASNDMFVPVDLVDQYIHTWIRGFFEDDKDTSAIPSKTNKILAAGKNFSSFDLPFLKSIGVGGKKSKTKFHHRSLDPGSLFYDPRYMDVPPSLEQCLKIAGVEKEVSHTALEDAIDVIMCIRHAYGFKF